MEIIRGDTKYYKFQRKQKHDGAVIETLPDKLYFTLKFSDMDDTPLIQKTLGKGIEYNQSDKYYYLTIDPSDTNDLPYGTYYYDIEVIKNNGYKKTIACGQLEITSEITFAKNEV